MNKEKKEFFTNDVEVDICREEILLATTMELIDEAKGIEQNTRSDEKFHFFLQYDVNQKDFLVSMLQTVGAVVEKDDEENYTFSTKMNITQMVFIKRLDCVKRVITNEGTNPFTKEHIESRLETDVSKNRTIETNLESTYVGGGGHITDAWPFECEDS